MTTKVTNKSRRLMHAYKAVAVNSLIERKQNPRTHSAAQIAQLVESIKEFGFTNPVLIDENHVVIAGHGRLAAARVLGLSDVPAIELHGLTESQKRALVIADNQLALKAQWDFTLLSQELTALSGVEFDLTLTGFERFELNELLSAPTDANSAWRGMPHFAQEDQLGFRVLIVHFADAAAVASFKQLIAQDFSDDAKYIWHPRAVADRVADKAFVSKSSSDDAAA